MVGTTGKVISNFFTNSIEVGHAASITLYFFTLISTRIDEVE